MTDKPKIGPDVFTLISSINAAELAEDAWNAYLESAHRVGFEYGFAKVSRRDTPLAVRLIAHEMPEGWLKNYTLRNYERYDGVAGRVRNASTAFEWSIGDWDKATVARQKQWQGEMREMGIRQGFSVPLTSRGDFRSVTVCGTGSDMHPNDRMTLHFAGIELLNRFRELLTNPISESQALSSRECECLHWAANGKSDGEIATILSLSEKTVNAYVERAKHKLGASTRVQAVALAMRDGLIAP